MHAEQAGGNLSPGGNPKKYGFNFAIISCPFSQNLLYDNG